MNGEPPPQSLDAIVREVRAMNCIKLETIYHAAAAPRWPHGGFAAPDIVSICRHFLQILVGLFGDATAPPSEGTQSVRALLSVETVEFFVQQFGEALYKGARALTAGAPLPEAAAVQARLPVSMVRLRPCSQTHGHADRSAMEHVPLCHVMC